MNSRIARRKIASRLEARKKIAAEQDEILDQLDDSQLLSLYSFLADGGSYEGIYDMYDFDELLDGKTPSEIAGMVAFGEYNASDDYFTFDGYGNLETLSSSSLRGQVEGILDFNTGLDDIREWAEENGEDIDFGDEEEEDEDY